MDTARIANTELDEIAGARTAPSARRRGVPRSERLALLRDWQASGLPAEAFAAGKQIAARSLYQWRCQEKSGKRAAAKGEQAAFREIKLADFAPRPAARSEVTLRAAGLEVSIAGCDAAALLPAILGYMRAEAGDV